MSRRVAVVIASVAILSHSVAPGLAADQPQLNFKIYSPPSEAAPSGSATTNSDGGSFWSENSTPAESAPAEKPAEKPVEKPVEKSEKRAESVTGNAASGAPPETATTAPAETTPTTAAAGETTRLQGYIRVVPSGTKIPIIMDSAVDSDTSQEGDEFAARTSEDLLIDGSTIVPAGSVIKGRIAQLNSPKHMCRSGSVALKFDTVTTPDNRQIPLVANLVARGGVVHARRGLKDVAIDTGTFALPMALGVGIGALAGNANSSKLGMGGGALIGAGIGAAVGVIVLCAKKGKKVDVRPGDELKIELAEDLRMPM